MTDLPLILGDIFGLLHTFRGHLEYTLLYFTRALTLALQRQLKLVQLVPHGQVPGATGCPPSTSSTSAIRSTIICIYYNHNTIFKVVDCGEVSTFQAANHFFANPNPTLHHMNMLSPPLVEMHHTTPPHCIT